MENTLIGNTYRMNVGVLETELFFETSDSMIFTVIEGGELTENGYSERVHITIVQIRPHVYMVAWKENSGATVIHVEDHENGIIYSNATLADGSFYKMKGTIQQI